MNQEHSNHHRMGEIYNHIEDNGGAGACGVEYASFLSDTPC
jgi:hypothetical protein